MDHLPRRSGRLSRAAGLALVLAGGPADGVGVVGAAAQVHPFEQGAAATGDVGDERGLERFVALVEVGVAVEDDADAVPGQQALQRPGPLQIGVRLLGPVVGVGRIVKDRELERRGVGRQVVGQPPVLGVRCHPLIGEVVVVDVGRAHVGIRPGGLQDVEAGVPGVEGVPGARVTAGGGAVETAIGVLLIAPARGGDGLILRPVEEVRVVGIAAVETMVADGREERHGGAHARPELGPEDPTQAGARLDQVAIVVLAARRVAVIAAGQGKARPAGRQLRHQVGLVGIGAAAVDRAPIAEHGEGVGRARTGRHLGEEVRIGISAQQVGRVVRNTR